MLENLCHSGRLRRAACVMPVVLMAMFLAPERALAQGISHTRPMWMRGIAVPEQERDLAQTRQIWLQEITDLSSETVQCHYDFQAFRKTTLDLLNKEPFTFFDLPGVAPLVDVPWLTVQMSVADNSGQCTLAVDYMICDKKSVTSSAPDGLTTVCPAAQRFLSFLLRPVSPDGVQAALSEMATEASQDLAEKWRQANPR